MQISIMCSTVDRDHLNQGLFKKNIFYLPLKCSNYHPISLGDVTPYVILLLGRIHLSLYVHPYHHLPFASLKTSRYQWQSLYCIIPSDHVKWPRIDWQSATGVWYWKHFFLIFAWLKWLMFMRLVFLKTAVRKQAIL